MAEQTYNELKDEVIFQLQKSDRIEIAGKIDGVRVDYPIKLDMIDDERITFKNPVTLEGEEIDVTLIEGNPDFSILSSNGYSYGFSCKIRKFTVESFAIAFPKNITKQPMRQDVRVDVNIPVEYWIDDEQNILYFSRDKSRKFNANVTNISGGGGFLITKEKIFFKNFSIKMEFNDNELRFLKVTKIKIVKVKSLRTPGSYGLAFMFSDMYSRDREKLIKWIFRVQLEQQKKEKERFDLGR